METGTSRFGASNFVGDGGSTIIFADWAHSNNATLYSVDINPLSVTIANQAIQECKANAFIIADDSLPFLKHFSKPIDFLYLDSYDFDIDNPNPSQEHHLKEIMAAYPYLTSNSVVMIDDCDLPHGGKGALAIEYLLKRGWKILESEYQVLLVKQKPNHVIFLDHGNA